MIDFLIVVGLGTAAGAVGVLFAAYLFRIAP